MLLDEEIAYYELSAWLVKIKKNPNLWHRFSKGIQHKINDIIPDKVHQAVTFAIEKMVKGVLFGSAYANPQLPADLPLAKRELKIRDRVKWYQRTASVEGAVTGAGGILMGFADFPAFLAIKMKMLFEIASMYGHDVKDFRERIFMLHVFQLAFSSQQKRQEVIEIIENWENAAKDLPVQGDSFDWKSFQIEYRDYMDLAKLAQLIPIIGAGVGAVANWQLSDHLADTAKYCYRLRYFHHKKAIE
ncbi:ABC transporter-associated protein EcsC [Echinicola pacifica]|uniref:ABC transporter-associated protein EcsC n=1 Tax=Echinicola pacifica TaxID=346377 RepID=A0A918Q251_9BACT|nr:EcsC family protein [Echinicola pacifica]GGZ31119.1 ABC transporter-associated protein EcsC [Echinicola pacifica]